MATERRHHSAKLTVEAVRNILASDEMGKVLAIDHRVSPSTITQIRKGRRWVWVNGKNGGGSPVNSG